VGWFFFSLGAMVAAYQEVYEVMLGADSRQST
jgi:hypothetical protein